MPQEQEKKVRIHIFSAFAMVILALVFDALQALTTLLNIIPGLGVAVGEYITIFSVIVFGIWFALCGVSYLDRNGATKMIITISSIVTELVPLIDIIPAITFGVVSLILITRAEDGLPGLLGMLQSRSNERMRIATPGEKETAKKRTEERIMRDQVQTPNTGREPRAIDRMRSYDRSAVARRVDEVRARNEVRDLSSPMLREYYGKEEGAGQEEDAFEESTV